MCAKYPVGGLDHPASLGQDKAKALASRLAEGTGDASLNHTGDFKQIQPPSRAEDKAER